MLGYEAYNVGASAAVHRDTAGLGGGSSSSAHSELSFRTSRICRACVCQRTVAQRGYQDQVMRHREGVNITSDARRDTAGSEVFQGHPGTPLQRGHQGKVMRLPTLGRRLLNKWTQLGLGRGLFVCAFRTTLSCLASRMCRACDCQRMAAQRGYQGQVMRLREGVSARL